MAMKSPPGSISPPAEFWDQLQIRPRTRVFGDGAPGSSFWKIMAASTFLGQIAIYRRRRASRPQWPASMPTLAAPYRGSWGSRNARPTPTCFLSPLSLCSLPVFRIESDKATSGGHRGEVAVGDESSPFCASSARANTPSPSAASSSSSQAEESSRGLPETTPASPTPPHPTELHRRNRAPPALSRVSLASPSA